MSRLKKDVQLTLLSRIPVMLLSFLSVVFLTRLLGPEGNGVYTFTFAVLNLFFTIVGFQLDTSLMVFLAKEKDQNAAVFSAVGILALLTVVVFGVLLTLAVFVLPGVEQWIIPIGQPTIFFFIFLLLAFFLRRITTLMQATLRGKFKFKSFNAFVVISQVIPASVYGVLLLRQIPGNQVLPVLDGLRIILLIETILAVFSIILVLRNHIVVFSKVFKKLVPPIAHLSYNSLLSAVGHFLNKRLDVWFVQFYRGTSALGQYGLATQIANFISDAMTPFNQVLIPYVAEASPAEHNEIVERSARLNFSLATIAAVLILTTSWLFVPVLFGNSFHDAIAATQILAISVIFISQRLVFTGYFKAINQMRYPVRAAWAGVLITIVLDILLIPGYGILGASIATTFAYLTSSGYLVIMAQRKLGFHMTDIMMLRKSDITWLLSRTKTKDH